MKLLVGLHTEKRIFDSSTVYPLPLDQQPLNLLGIYMNNGLSAGHVQVDVLTSTSPTGNPGVLESKTSYKKIFAIALAEHRTQL